MIEFDGVEEFEKEIRRLDKLKEKYREMLKNFIIKIGDKIIREVKGRTPYITTNLKNSWMLGDVKVDGDIVSIQILNNAKKDNKYIEDWGIDNAYYATFVEYGHRGVFNQKLGYVINKDTAYTKGRYMLTTTLQLIDKVIDNEYREYFNQFKLEQGWI